MRYKCIISFLLLLLTNVTLAAPLFLITVAPSSYPFDKTMNLNDSPQTMQFTITNQTGVEMPNVIYTLPAPFYRITSDTNNCGTTLANGQQCTLTVGFSPNKIGSFGGKLSVCGGGGIWCSKANVPFNVTVSQWVIPTHSCSDLQTRPFASLFCNSTEQYSENLLHFLQQVLGKTPTKSSFTFFQHKPSDDETTTDCLQATQTGIDLPAGIKGGGEPLCKLLAYAGTTGADSGSSYATKLFPPYLTRLLGTSFPIEVGSTVPLDKITTLTSEFGTSDMDSMVRSLGYFGHYNYVTDYFKFQLGKTYSTCGSTESCPSTFYLPYVYSGPKSDLATWQPPENSILYNHFWGMSGGGGGGSGAGYEIKAFNTGQATHYTLFSGGGGGGGGMTSPEITSTPINLNSSGSGGGGGSQFSDCFVEGGVNLNGLGLGSGTGSGLNMPIGTNVTYKTAPIVQYSYYAANSQPTQDKTVIMNNYKNNLTALVTQIKTLYDQGYTVTIVGGGGVGLEFLDSHNEEYNPHPVSIGYGFTFCFAFNKNGLYNKSDCDEDIPANFQQTQHPRHIQTETDDVQALIYKSIGPYYKRGMDLAIPPGNCNGYKDTECTCLFQNNYVIQQVTQLLQTHGYPTSQIPSWLLNPHCDYTDGLQNYGNPRQQFELRLLNSANQLNKTEGVLISGKRYPAFLQQLLQYHDATTCHPPWTTNVITK